MARRKVAQQLEVAVETVEAAIEIAVEPAAETVDMGDFAILPYWEEKRPALFYGVREMYGQAVKRLHSNMDWEEFNRKFDETFGNSSVEELKQFALEYFSKSPEEVLEVNSKAMERKRQREEQARMEIPKPKVSPPVAVAPVAVVPVVTDEEELPY